MQTETRSPESKVQALSKTALFEALSPADLERLGGLTRALTFAPNEVIFRKGDLTPTLYVIERGRVKISTGSAEGREVVLNLLGPPSVFGEVALMDGGARTADATAVEPVTMLALDRRDMIPFLESQPALMLRMLVAMTQRLRWVSERYEDAVFLELPARLAKRLLLLGELFGFDTAKGRRLTVALPQREIAGHMGVSRETVNRLLQEWLGKGYIENDRGVLILKDQPALGKIAGTDHAV
jgi:CRP/FNR family cyclic AMP-dependent transcriptional regulator